MKGKNWRKTTRRGGNHHRKIGSTNIYLAQILFWKQIQVESIPEHLDAEPDYVCKCSLYPLSLRSTSSSSRFILRTVGWCGNSSINNNSNYKNKVIQSDRSSINDLKFYLPKCVSWPDTHPHNDLKVVFFLQVCSCLPHTLPLLQWLFRLQETRRPAVTCSIAMLAPNATHYWSKCFTAGVFIRSLPFMWITIGYRHGNNQLHSQYQ